MSDKKIHILPKNIFTFLVACSKEECSTIDIEQITSYVDDPNFDLDRVIRVANEHGVLPLVHKKLKKIYDHENQTFPKNLLAIRSAYFSTVQANMKMTATLINLVDIFHQNSIEVLPFKGPTLSQLIYHDITLRQYADLDILVHQKDIHKIEELCLSMGYRLHYSLSNAQKRHWYKHAKDMVFYHPQKNITLEIHWLLFDTDFPIRLHTTTDWKYPQTLTLNNKIIHTFSAEKMLLYLCIHGSKHLWERLIWIKDIDLIIRTQKINVKKLLLLSEETHSKRMLLLGLYLSQKLFETPLLEEIEIEMQKEEKGLSYLSNALLEHMEKPIGKIQQTKLMLRLFPKNKMKIQYLYKIVIKPSHHEYRFITLPKELYWVYYLIRPFLLTKKYLFKDQ